MPAVERAGTAAVPGEEVGLVPPEGAFGADELGDDEGGGGDAAGVEGGQGVGEDAAVGVVEGDQDAAGRQRALFGDGLEDGGERDRGGQSSEPVELGAEGPVVGDAVVGEDGEALCGAGAEQGLDGANRSHSPRASARPRSAVGWRRVAVGSGRTNGTGLVGAMEIDVVDWDCGTVPPRSPSGVAVPPEDGARPPTPGSGGSASWVFRSAVGGSHPSRERLLDRSMPLRPLHRADGCTGGTRIFRGLM